MNIKGIIGAGIGLIMFDKIFKITQEVKPQKQTLKKGIKTKEAQEKTKSLKINKIGGFRI